MGKMERMLSKWGRGVQPCKSNGMKNSQLPCESAPFVWYNQSHYLAGIVLGFDPECNPPPVPIHHPTQMAHQCLIFISVIQFHHVGGYGKLDVWLNNNLPSGHWSIADGGCIIAYGLNFLSRIGSRCRGRRMVRWRHHRYARQVRSKKQELTNLCSYIT